ncbi:MAG TPA: hypothetical protein VGE74_05165 [Gemmata sp.]
MKTLSGLSDSVRADVGHALEMHLEYGWGWTVGRDSWATEPFAEVSVVNLTTVQVVPSEFFADGGASTRGFLGRVSQLGHLLHDLPVLAFTMSDGFDHDFTAHNCGAWRFFFGEGELVCPPDSFPRLHGARIIGGYGRVTKDEITPRD